MATQTGAAIVVRRGTLDSYESLDFSRVRSPLELLSFVWAAIALGEYDADGKPLFERARKTLGQLSAESILSLSSHSRIRRRSFHRQSADNLRVVSALEHMTLLSQASRLELWGYSTFPGLPVLSTAMRKMTIGGVCAAFLGAGTAMSTPSDITIGLLLDICAAPTVEAAAAKGNALGWQRLSGTQVEEWRRRFLAYNGGTVDVAGWRQEPYSEDESLSFWVAVGPNGHKACAYSTARFAGVLDALSERLGKPDMLDRNDAMKSVSAWWKRGFAQYSFTQVGSRAIVNIRRDE